LCSAVGLPTRSSLLLEPRSLLATINSCAVARLFFFFLLAQPALQSPRWQALPMPLISLGRRHYIGYDRKPYVVDIDYSVSDTYLAVLVNADLLTVSVGLRLAAVDSGHRPSSATTVWMVSHKPLRILISVGSVPGALL
jgi:hypothetical protein